MNNIIKYKHYAVVIVLKFIEYFSEKIDRNEQSESDRPETVPQVRQDLPFGPHAPHASGGQAHHLFRVQVRAVRHGGQIQKLIALAHVAPAPGHQHQRPARPADALQLRSGTRVQPAPESWSQGILYSTATGRGCGRLTRARISRWPAQRPKI